MFPYLLSGFLLFLFWLPLVFPKRNFHYLFLLAEQCPFPSLTTNEHSIT